MSEATLEAGQSPFRTRAEREQERAEKREAVLLAAARMFNARGFHATSLDDVAASLGVSKPTIYHYLGNKDQVLMECVKRGHRLLQEAADQAHAARGTGFERLRDFLKRYAEISMGDFGGCVIRTGDEQLSPGSAAEFRALKGKIDRAMRSLIKVGVEDSSVAASDIKLTAFTLAGALNWPARWFDACGAASASVLAEKMVNILTAGLAPR